MLYWLHFGIIFFKDFFGHCKTYNIPVLDLWGFIIQVDEFNDFFNKIKIQRLENTLK